MKEKIICFSLGLSEEDIKKGKDSYYALNEEAPLLELMAVTGFMLERDFSFFSTSSHSHSGYNSRQGLAISMVQTSWPSHSSRSQSRYFVGTANRPLVSRAMACAPRSMPHPAVWLFPASQRIE